MYVAATFFRTKVTVLAQSAYSCLPGFGAPKRDRIGLPDLRALSLRSDRRLREAGGGFASPLPRSHRALSAVKRDVASLLHFP